MKKILVVGDVMLDKYSFGRVVRLNPESPAPLINIEREEWRLGGAANVAANIASLTGDCSLIGSVGSDQNGQVFSGLCTKHSISLLGIRSERPTTTKWRFIDTTYDQQLLRADYEEKYSLSLSETDELVAAILREDPEILVISDYDKGMVNGNFIERVKAPGRKILVDSKPRNTQNFKGCFLIKPNFKEFASMTGEEIRNADADVEFHGKRIAKEFGSNMVITRGEKGASLVTPEWEVFHLPTEARAVFDVSGAGDTFLAAIAVALQEGSSLVDAVRFWNRASWVVVGKVGTAIVTRDDIDNTTLAWR